MRYRILQAERHEFVGWAVRKAAALEATVFRHAKSAGFESKVLSPADGVFVHLRRSTLGEWKIRVTGDVEDVRYWQAAPEALSTRAFGSSVRRQENFQPAAWSQDFSTFARASGGDVVLKRYTKDGPVEATMVSVSALFRAEPASFYKNPVVYLEPSGKVAVALPTAPSPTKVAAVARWVDGAWSQVDVPFPFAASGVNSTGMAAPSYDTASGYFSTSGGSDTIVQALDDKPGGTVTVFVPPTAWRVFVDPYHPGSLYLDARYWTGLGLGNVIADPNPGGHANPGGVLAARLTPHEELWRYSISTGSWAKVSTQDFAVGSLTVFTQLTFFDGISHGGSGSGTLGTAGDWGNPAAGTPMDCDFVYYTPYFGPYDGAHIVSVDNRVGSTPGATRSATADMKLDGSPWILGVSVPTTDPTAPVAVEDADAGLEVTQLGQAGRGALADGTWRYGETEATVAPSAGARLYSRDMRWLAADADVYHDGALQGAVDLSGPQVLLASWRSPGVFLASHSIDLPPAGAFTYEGQGGTVEISGFGTFPVGGGTSAFDLTGTLLASLSLGVLTQLTAAELSAMLGGAAVTFHPNGVPTTIEVPEGGFDPPPEPKLSAVRVTADGTSVVRSYQLTVDDVTYESSKAVPSTFVIK